MLMCNECGKFFKRLHTKHLVKHGLTSDEYKKKYGYQKTTGMIADQESINISKRILGKSHSININKEALEKRKQNHSIAMAS
jgi:predicted transcriptional regulator